MDNLLPGFEPSEADMIQMALDMPLERKVEKAIKFFQTYCEGAYGAFSGGKDSCVIKELAKQAGVKNIEWVYNNTTLDAPELVSFLRKYHPDVKWNNPKIGLLKRMVEKCNLPTRRGRWCCSEYKESNGKGQPVVIGVRISESKRRAALWQQIVHLKNKQVMLCPICYWTDNDVWAFIRSNNVPYCSLYDEGFDRLGCVGCPLTSNRAKEFARWPRFEAAWKKAVWATWEKSQTTLNRRGEKYYVSKFPSAEALWAWWMEEDNSEANCVFEEMMEQR